jgi:hypothetical protein
MAEVGQYYALCVRDEGGKGEVAFLDLGRDKDGQLVGLAVYTAPDGAVQREDLEKYEGETTISPVSHEELLEAAQQSIPNSVFVNGNKIAGSVFEEHLKEVLSIPLKQPRLLPPDTPAP